jgi:hypothetical protein
LSSSLLSTTTSLFSTLLLSFSTTTSLFSTTSFTWDDGIVPTISY